MKHPIDYSAYELEAKKLLKDISDLLKRSQYEEAAGLIDDTIVELRMMKAAVNSHIKD